MRGVRWVEAMQGAAGELRVAGERRVAGEARQLCGCKVGMGGKRRLCARA